MRARTFLPQRHHGKAGADTNGPSLCQSADFNLVLQICQSLKLAGKAIGVAKCVPRLHGAHLWEVFWLKELGGGWGRVCTLDSILNRYFCSIKSSVGG